MHCDLFLADLFDTMQSGKTLAVGLYTDRVVILNIPHDAPDFQKVPYGITLSVLACLSQLAPGAHSVELALENEAGETLGWFNSKLLKIDVEAGRTANCLVKFDPFLVTYEGAHYFVTKIGAEVQRVPFWIRLNRLPAKSSPQQSVD